MGLKLSKEYEYDGKQYKELKLNLEELTGKDMLTAEKEAKLLDPHINVPELSKTYLAVLASRAAQVPVDFVVNLKAKDFSAVTLEVQNFLLE